MFKKMRTGLKNFFFPPPGSPRWKSMLSIIVLTVFVLMALVGGTYGWEYSNSPQFCGTTCHTMPPQNAVYIESPHANVTCEECHIGRASFVNQLTRKSQGLKELYYQVFHLYELPIRAKALRPAADTCEKCHRPETFSDDSLHVIPHFGDDADNTATSTYLILKTGGGTKRQGLGLGIHWHIENPVYYYATDELSQNIPYVKVENEDGTFTEYVDVESGFDAASLGQSQLKQMDCITCHNRVTHDFQQPSISVDESISRGLISASIPNIRNRAVVALSATYASRDEAFKAMDAVAEAYKSTAYYTGHEAEIQAAIDEIKAIYARTVFPDQKVDWTTHPNNLGHINTPGCFRCHDGKHLNDQNQAVRLECNLCHSIPIVASSQDFTANIEVNRGPEPESHLNANWISLHNQAFDATCANCHTTEGAGGTSNTTFCSNSACHGSVYTFAGFDAPKLREILEPQIPTPAPAPTTSSAPANPTFENSIGSLFASRCTACHGSTPTAGLSFLTYADALKGSKNGAVILPGDSANSRLVIVQSGNHFALFTSEELALIIQWIDSGAAEN
jgi:nitrate/TMAO reductase-like tetraheme cytochrome c subunit/mono/diheme cytochrome c family protein